MKRFLSAIAGVVCASMVLSAVQVFAKDNTTITKDQAQEAARKAVPSSCALLTTDIERYFYEVKFFDKTNQEKYIVQIGKSEGDVLELTVQTADAGGKAVNISQEAAIQTVRALYADAVDVTATLKTGELSWYEVSYRTPFTSGTARINAENGKVMSRDDIYYQAKNEELGDVVKSSATAATLGGAVTEASVLEKAQNAVPGGAVDRIQLTGNGTLYEVKMHKGDYEYDLFYDAATGARLSFSTSFDPTDFSSDWYQKPGTVKKESPRFGMAQVQAPSSVKSTGSQGEYITRERAVEIARRSAPSGAKLNSMSLKHSGDSTYYQGYLKLDGVRYGFRIDAESGSVIDSSVEVDESWDPDAHHEADTKDDDDRRYEMKWDD